MDLTWFQEYLPTHWILAVVVTITFSSAAAATYMQLSSCIAFLVTFKNNNALWECPHLSRHAAHLISYAFCFLNALQTCALFQKTDF